MKKRILLSTLKSRLSQFPAVTLVGPRQCGKTTLATEIGSLYFNLEAPEERLRLDALWPKVMKEKGPVVLDEAQYWPELFLRLRGEIDADRKRNGRFILLGSVSPSLMRNVGESLAGRMAMVELSPFILGEVNDLESLWRFGGYPDGGILDKSVFPVWSENYLRTMAERDLPTWGLAAKPQLTQRLFRMLAAEQGSILNLSKLGQSLGISYHTVGTYLDYLEGAYLTRRLPAFSANLLKRLVKSPRIYWRDSGLLHALLRWDKDDEVYAQPWVGASWEGFVIEQILGSLEARGITHDAFYFRTHDGFEADLVIEKGRHREVIEIKLTSAPTTQDIERLRSVARLIDATNITLICRIEKPVATDHIRITHLPGYLEQ